jgi:PAS domain S-box-containing protein
MNDAEFQLDLRGDPRLAPYAASRLPAWLWTADGKRILWANPAGVAVFGAVSGRARRETDFGPADRHRRQIARLAAQLPANGAIRLERLQGFGAAPGMLATCGCWRFDFPNGSHGVLIAAGSIALMAPGPALVVPVPPTIAAVPEKTAATPDVTVVPQPEPAYDYEQPAQSGEAPAEFALFDAFAEPTMDESSEPTRETTAEADPVRAEAPPPDMPRIETLPLPVIEDDAAEPRHLPLRFMWQMDRESRFKLGPGEFARLIGPRVTAGLGRTWREIAEALALDPDGRVTKAFATQATWSDIALEWPIDGGSLKVELSGLPLFDVRRNFAGYRGFGLCRDIDGLTRLDALRRDEAANPPLPETIVIDPPIAEDMAALSLVELPEATAEETSQEELDTTVEPPEEIPAEALAELPAAPPANVVPFRAPGDTRPPSLTPVENSAFDELARQLSARLDTDDDETSANTENEVLFEAPASDAREPAAGQPEWLATPEPPARGEGRRDKTLLDLLPIGILIYRLDRLLYANPAFLTEMGYPSLHALEDAGGLDALYVEPGVSNALSTSDTGTPVMISASHPAEADAPRPATNARLYTIAWDGDSALALIFAGARHEGEAIAAAIAQAEPLAEPEITEAPAVGHANAEELAAILDTTADGIVMFDAEGNISSANRSAEALFGRDDDELAQRNLAELFAPESRHDVFEYLASIKSSGVASLLDHGREVLGRESKGGIIPLSLTMGRTRADGPNFFAVFRDLSQAHHTENELREARRLADRAANAKADVLARISHEIRTPLNAIIGFAEVMIGERFGALGNERYLEYMKDIRASGERVIAIVNDLLDLSRIETGKLDLAFTNQNLNELVENCVAVMQPQANRERIIIRTSLSHTLPPVMADARALRQITLNLIGNSMHLANAGGQVIVSTALSDFGEVMLRVRDTGHGLNDNEVAAALEPFRTAAPSDQTSEGSGVSLSLTKALVEANRAKFQIKTGGRSGTLIEVVFPHATARA